MEPFHHHPFVCTQEKPEGVSCSCYRSWQVLQALEREIAAQGLENEVQLSTGGCLGLCDDGPIVICYPEGVWYRKVQPSDAAEIVR